MRLTIKPVAVLVTASAVLAACSSNGSATANNSPAAGSSQGPQNAATQLVPAAIKSKGVMVVGTEGDYPPGSFVASDGHTLVGSDIDFITALGKTLGLRVKLQASKFETLIPGLQDGKFDLAASGIFDTKARENVVDLVVYQQTGKAFYTKSGTSKSFNGLQSLCSASVAVLAGSVELSDAQAQAKKCKVNVLSFADQNAANLAVSTGRADVGFVDSPLSGYLVRQTNGQFQPAGTAFGFVPNGLAVPKGSALAKAIAAAVKLLMQSGQYAQILKKWGATSDAVTAPVINGATS